MPSAVRGRFPTGRPEPSLTAGRWVLFGRSPVPNLRFHADSPRPAAVPLVNRYDRVPRTLSPFVSIREQGIAQLSEARTTHTDDKT